MKTLKTNINGGFPFVLDDMRWVAGGIYDVLKGIGKGLGNGSDCILYGCVVTGAITGTGPWTLTYGMTEGWAFINGEICYVPAVAPGTVLVTPGAGLNFWFDIVTTFDATGFKTFDDGGTHDTYQVNVAAIITGAAIPAGRLLFTNIPTIYAQINAGPSAAIATTNGNLAAEIARATGVENQILEPWTKINLDNTNTTYSGTSVGSITGSLNYKKIGKTLMLTVNLGVGALSGDGTTITIQIPATWGTNTIVSDMGFNDLSTPTPVANVVKVIGDAGNSYIVIQSTTGSSNLGGSGEIICKLTGEIL